MQARCYGALPLTVVAAQRQQLSTLWQFTSSRPLHSKVAVAESEVDVLADADKDLFDVYQVTKLLLYGPSATLTKVAAVATLPVECSIGFVSCKHVLADTVSRHLIVVQLQHTPCLTPCALLCPAAG